MTKAELEKKVDQLDRDQLETLQMMHKLMDLTDGIMNAVQMMAKVVTKDNIFDKHEITH